MKGRSRPKWPATVASDQRASEVRVYDAATGELIRTEEPYRQYGTDDPRRARSKFDRDTYGNWNLDRTSNPRRDSAAPTHPAAVTDERTTQP